MNTSSESGSYYCQKMAMKVHSSMLKHVVTNVLRMGSESLSQWTRTVNVVVSSKQIKTLLLASCWLPVRKPTDTITPASPSRSLLPFFYVLRSFNWGLYFIQGLPVPSVPRWTGLFIPYFLLPQFQVLPFFHHFYGLLPLLFPFCPTSGQVVGIPTQGVKI